MTTMLRTASATEIATPTRRLGTISWKWMVTTDHKVITGAEWFRGVYDDRVYTAETLDDVEPILRKILQNPPQGKTDDYFERNYYRKLKALIESSIFAKEEK